MQSIMGMEAVKNRFPIPNKRWNIEITNYRITKTRFTLLSNRSDAIYYRYRKGKKSVSTSEQTLRYRSYQLLNYRKSIHTSE